MRGVFCWCFSDFGEDFEVVDSNGEEPREVFISDVRKVRQMVAAIPSPADYFSRGVAWLDISFEIVSLIAEMFL